MVDDVRIRHEGVVNMDKLRASTIALVGSGPLAKYAALSMAALGFGKLRILSNDSVEGSLLDIAFKGEYTVAIHTALKENMERITDKTTLETVSAPMNVKGADYFLEGSDVVVDLTNDPVSKTVCAEHARARNIPMYSVSSCRGYGKLMRLNDLDYRILLREFHGLEQDELVSIILSAALCEEVKREVCGQDTLNQPFYYNMSYADRFSFKRVRQIPERPDLSDKSVLMVGAGALGNFVGLALSYYGVGNITIIDDDAVETHNLNRQVYFYDSIGQPKASSLADKLRRKGVACNSLHGRFDENFPHSNYDVMFACVDSLTARADMSDFAVRHKIPLVSGGTNYHSGHVLTYFPGMTNCGNCQYGYRMLAEQINEQGRQQGCLAEPDPSVIMSNMLTAGIMMAEALCVFDPVSYGYPVRGLIEYDADSDLRARVHNARLICRCGGEV